MLGPLVLALAPVAVRGLSVAAAAGRRCGATLRALRRGRAATSGCAAPAPLRPANVLLLPVLLDRSMVAIVMHAVCVMQGLPSLIRSEQWVARR